MATVYRHFDCRGNLLYVGSTTNHIRRLFQHATGADWWNSISTITLVHFKSIKLASSAERKAIKCERPKFNICHNASRPKRKLELSNAELRDKIRAGNDFVVQTISERKRALMVASVLNIEIITRESDGGAYRIFIPSDVPN